MGVVHSRPGTYTYSSSGRFSKHRSLCFPWDGNRAPQYPPPTLDYSRILPWLIVRLCPTRESAVAHGSESFVGVVHSRRYVYIQPWWYSSRVHARIAALLAVRTGHTVVVEMMQRQCARSWDTRRDDELVGCLVFFKSAYFLQRSFLVQHGGAVDITREGHQHPVTKLWHPCMNQRKVLSSPSEPMPFILDLKTINKSNTPATLF